MAWPLLRNRDYMLLWSGQVVSTLGSSAAWIIYPLLILALWYVFLAVLTTVNRDVREARPIHQAAGA